MPASYPTSAKSFTTKNSGDSIQAAHVNDLQDEVTAVETDLIAGLPVTRGGTGVTTANAFRMAATAVVTALVDGANVALDASTGSVFTLTAAGDRTLLAPTNATDGQKIVMKHKASGADRTLTLTTGSAGAFRFGANITGLTATASTKTDFIGCIYDGADQRWDVVAYMKGY